MTLSTFSWLSEFQAFLDSFTYPTLVLFGPDSLTQKSHHHNQANLLQNTNNIQFTRTCNRHYYEYTELPLNTSYSVNKCILWQHSIPWKVCKSQLQTSPDQYNITYLRRIANNFIRWLLNVCLIKSQNNLCNMSGKAGYILCINVDFIIWPCPHFMRVKLSRLVNPYEPSVP